MSTSTNWAVEFAKIIACQACDSHTDRNLLRDADENVPQPGYIGSNYWSHRVLFIGKNPGTPKSLADPDKPHTRALRQLMDDPNQGNYQAL